MTAILDQVTAAFTQRIAAWPYRGGQLVGTPFTLDGGEVVTVEIQQVGHDLFNVTDRGLAATSLANAGVELGDNVAGRSFLAVQSGLSLAAPLGTEITDFELAGSAALDQLGDAVLLLSEAVLRIDGLRALARNRKPRTFRDRVVRVAGELDLAVVVAAPMPIKWGGKKRQVSCRISGAAGLETWVQAVGRDNQMAYDHARSLFSDSAVPLSQRMTAIERLARVDPWQRQALSDVSVVVDEEDLPSSLSNLAA